VAGAVFAASAPAELAEDQVKALLPDGPLALAGQDRPLPFLADQVLLLQLGPEGVEVEVGRQQAALLKMLQPAEGFLDVAVGLEQQVVEEALESLKAPSRSRSASSHSE